MSDRHTPETDAFAIKFKTTCGEKYWVPADIARKLERERDEAKKELGEYRSIAENIGAKKAVSEKEKAIHERDEALKLGNNLADECERILGLGLHQNTLPRFKAALEAWRKNT